MEKQHFPQFYQKHVRRIYRYFYYRVSGNCDVAEDLTQDVFLKALDAFERYDENVSEFSWIYTIARNHLLNSIAKTRPTVELEDIENTIWDRQDWIAAAELRYDEKRLLEAMRGIPKEDAELLQRKHLEGWSYDEIAEVCGKSPGALRIQAHRALKQLRTILKKL